MTFDLYSKALGQGLGVAQNNVGVMHARGESSVQNIDLSFDNFYTPIANTNSFTVIFCECYFFCPR